MFSEFQKACAILVPGHENLLEEPPKGLADLALPCFALAAQQKKNPAEIALEIASKIKLPKKSLVSRVEANGPYVNFFINYGAFTPAVIRAASKKMFGSGGRKKEKVMIESPGPNTNKPLHLGHMRNMALGISLSRLLEFSGYPVSRVDIVNDRGVAICKTMLAYEKLCLGRLPDKKPDHFIGDLYVRFAKELEERPETGEELREMLRKWEAKDAKTIALWSKTRNWALKGINETYRRFGVSIDKPYYESDHYEKGRKIAQDGLKKGVFMKDEEGNIVADLEKDGLGKRVLVRNDGTTVYITQDLALAGLRRREFGMDRMIYIVGVEQVEHFRALFRIYELLGYPFAKNCFHLAYGMVNLPEGKMKSREGTVVDADDLMDEMHALAAEEISKREQGIDKKELDARAEKIGLAAIKFFILKFDAQKTITYDPSVSLSFEGDSGPYLMYAYARAKSVQRKSKKKPLAKAIGSEGAALVKKISMFPDAVSHATREYKPHIIATYSLELAAAFNEYYHSVKIINSDDESARLGLVAAAANVLKSCMDLLGIDALEKM